mmetsp:Transcript_51554/g.112285  ORF Transcript_51554/g.112285 Transcript_51554/m.112285 type:complete len:262 (+) Transcript_51554:1302-2087(+)
MLENVAFGLSGSFGSFTSAMGITGMSRTRSSICGVGGKGAGVGGKPPRSLMWPVRGPALWLPRRVPKYAQLLSTDPGGMGETALLGAHAIGDSGEAVGNGKEALAFGIAWLGAAFTARGGRLRLSIGAIASIFMGSTFTGSSEGGQGGWLSDLQAGRYVMISLPLEPSTLNSLGHEDRKCFKPWSVFFKYKREPGDRATPSILRSNLAFPSMLMCCRHSSRTCCLVIPKASISSSWHSLASPTAFLNLNLFGRSEYRKIST